MFSSNIGLVITSLSQTRRTTFLSLFKYILQSIAEMITKTILFYLLCLGLLHCPGSTEEIKLSNQKNDDLPASNKSDNYHQPQQRCNTKLNRIVGNIFSLQHDDSIATRMSLMKTRVLFNHGQYISYPKEDGSFTVENIPSGSYVVEITHPKFIYEPVRVDISSKGGIRARRVNYVQHNLVQTVDYPLKLRPVSLHNYFMPRETWRIMDLLLNPMVVMMIVPLVIIWLLPKMMNPQEVQSQRESMQMPEYNVPELSEMMAGMFGGQAQAQGSQAITAGSKGDSGQSKHGKSKRR